MSLPANADNVGRFPVTEAELVSKIGQPRELVAIYRNAKLKANVEWAMVGKCIRLTAAAAVRLQLLLASGEQGAGSEEKPSGAASTTDLPAPCSLLPAASDAPNVVQRSALSPLARLVVVDRCRPGPLMLKVRRPAVAGKPVPEVFYCRVRDNSAFWPGLVIQARPCGTQAIWEYVGSYPPRKLPPEPQTNPES